MSTLAPPNAQPQGILGICKHKCGGASTDAEKRAEKGRGRSKGGKKKREKKREKITKKGE